MSTSLIRSLNCMANQQNYGSIDTIDSTNPTTSTEKHKTKKRLSLAKKFRRIRNQLNTMNFADEYSIAYESCPEEPSLNERTELVKKGKNKVRRYSAAAVNDDKIAPKLLKANLTTLEDFLNDKSTKTKQKVGQKKNKKKKSGFLKRTGKFIVRTCRMMSYSSPYATHVPPDFYNPDLGAPRYYRFYDFEKGEYDLGYVNNYMGYTTYTPSVFF